MKKILILFLLMLSIFVTGCQQIQQANEINERINKPYSLQSIKSYDEIKSLIKRQEFFDFFTNFSFLGKDAILEDAADNETPTSPVDSSQTNVVCEGVDEADTIKNDGRFVYIINNQKLYILDSKTDKYINYELDSFVPQSMYIYNNRIILLGSIIEQTYEKSFYWKYYSNNAIKILQINNEDINNISEIRLSEFYSSYISESRLIDKYLYIKLYAFNIYDSNADKINPFTYKDSFKGDEIITLKEENVFFVGEKKASRYNYEVLIGLDISEEKDIDVNAYLGGLGTIYSSKNGIFTSKTYYSINKKTYFYHFIYDEEKIVFDNFTSIDGTNYIYNNFSMDEYNGTFRTVVTSSNANNQRESYVYTFNIKDHKFDFISKIGGIGVNESVYSIRFDKERLYIVTFRTIDPYYVIDVSDPANMKILGELKLPGVSDYLHVITDNLQLGIGRRTKDNGYGGVTSDGIKITLFDTTDENNPQDISTIEMKDAYSEISYDYKSLITLPSINLFAIVVYKYTANGSNQGMYVFKVNIDSKKLEEVGFITHNEQNNYDNYISKGMIVNSKLYCVSNNYISVSSLESGLPLVYQIKIK